MVTARNFGGVNTNWQLKTEMVDAADAPRVDLLSAALQVVRNTRLLQGGNTCSMGKPHVGYRADHCIWWLPRDRRHVDWRESSVPCTLSQDLSFLRTPARKYDNIPSNILPG
jgi:hypothetical protein